MAFLRATQGFQSHRRHFLQLRNSATPQMRGANAEVKVIHRTVTPIMLTRTLFAANSRLLRGLPSVGSR
jgi:hypothetical protein